MTKQTEALKLALEALEAIGDEFVCRATHHKKSDQHGFYATCPNAARHQQAITAIREALAEQPAQPQQEPVAWSKAYDMIDRFLQNNLNSDEDRAEYSAALDCLYTSPPASKPWVGLTDDDREAAMDGTYDRWDIAEAIEAKLREKNA